MIRRNQKTINRINILTDALLVFLSYMFASWLWLSVIKKEANMAALANWNSGVALAAVLYAGAGASTGCWTTRCTRMRRTA